MSICILITALIILGNRFGVREGIGVVLGFTGVAVIVTRGDVNVLFGLTFNIGDIILLLATMSYWSTRCSCGARRQTELQRADGGNVRIRGAAHAAAVAGRAIRFRPVRADEPHRRVVDRVHDAGAVGAGKIFWAYSVSRVGPGTAGYFASAPVFGVVLTSLLGEQFYMFHAAGIVLIFTGIWLTARKQAA